MIGHLWLRMIVVLTTAQLGNVYAGTFHTIIGPDGRPMVVQKNNIQTKKVLESNQKNQILHPQSQVMTAPPKLQSSQIVIEQKIKQNNPIEDKNNLSHSKIINKTDTLSSSIFTKDIPETRSTNTLEQNIDNSIEPIVAQQSVLKTEDLQPTLAENLKKRLDDQNDILEIEGNQYVKNEVLEEKEFNLDGKKRFYTMPEGIIDTKNGATRLQTVQREKGIGQSVMQALFKKNRATGQDTPLILAVTYYRISAETASEGMGRTCFQDKKLKKAKDIALDTQVNLWPRAPLKDEFDFEVVKLKQPLQNIQIQSYASRQKDPTFYWPFAVFLDEKGCILEGAGGFKNNDSASDYLKYENIEGMIQVPRNSHYLLLTPLASAIDVEERVLSNQGQLKLIGIR